MSLQGLINKFLIITGYDKDKSVLAIIFHGSRVQGRERPNSDLDVIVISKKGNNYKKGFAIDGIRVDCHIYSINDIYDLADIKKESNNIFLECVLNKGLVVKDVDDTIAMIKNYIENMEVKKQGKRFIPRYVLEDIRDLYSNFINKKEDNEFYYYNLLEKIRIAFNYLYGCSYLGTSKVYEVFKRPAYFHDKYLIKLPNHNFIDLYLKAIEAKEEERIELIQKLISLLHIKLGDIETSNYYGRNIYYSKDRIDDDMLILHNKLLKTIDLLLIKHPYSKMMYAILLQSMYSYYYQIYYDINYQLEELYNRGINEKDNNERIEIIKDIFDILSKDYFIDYDNYLIRLELIN